MKNLLNLLAIALLTSCMPDLDALSDGVPAMGCEWSPVESGATTVPEGECWRVIALTAETRVRLDGETCDDARACVTAAAGETVVPMIALGADVRNEDFETVAWPCEELVGACLEE